MIRQLHYLGLLLPLFTTSSWAAEQNSSVHIAPAGSHTAVYGSAENFIGRVRVDPLIVTSGVGLTQQEGKPVQVIRAGDVISCPADVKHWHGAAPGSAMTHLAITGMVDGKSVNWKELVTDEQYHAH
ncbi:cupin domain-containing protein [Escherichia coli]|nr:cupin domain-containing protein [Escherichia coli]